MTKSKIFKELDKRNTGYSYWKYYINRTFYRSRSSNIITLYDSTQLFYSWREWCWNTWGSSKELDSWLEDFRHMQSSNSAISHNEHWCFQHNQYATRIYLRTDKELSMFLLRWSQ